MLLTQYAACHVSPQSHGFLPLFRKIINVFSSVLTVKLTVPLHSNKRNRKAIVQKKIQIVINFYYPLRTKENKNRIKGS